MAASNFSGRADSQVKLRGHRIELGEIEAALDALDGVTQAVVVERTDGPTGDRLVGYVTGDGTLEEATLKRALAGRLPGHMVPARILRIDAIPQTPNRKVDRKALPDPGTVEVRDPPATSDAPEAGAAAGPASGATLDAVSAIWERVLGIGRAGPRDNFFDLGGHSLLAVQVHREIRDKFGVARLRITDIFRHTTLGALSAHVETLLDGSAERPGGRPPTASAPNASSTAVAPRFVTDRAADPATARAQARSEATARRRELRARRVQKA